MIRNAWIDEASLPTARASALYHLTSIVDGRDFTAFVSDKFGAAIAWAVDGIACPVRRVPTPFQVAVCNAYAAGIYAAVFEGVRRV